VSDQAARAGDLDRAVTEHLDRVTPLTRFVGEDRDHGSLDVIAVILVDLVTDFKLRSRSGIHGESFRIQALRPVRLNYGISVFGVTERNEASRDL
jgi:hypothetical protein